MRKNPYIKNSVYIPEKSNFYHMKHLQFNKKQFRFGSIRKFPDCRYDIILLCLLNNGVTDEYVLLGNTHIYSKEEFVNNIRIHFSSLQWIKDIPKAESIVAEYIGKLSSYEQSTAF